MNLTISGHHIEVTPAMQRHAEECVNRAIKAANVVDVRVHMRVDKKIANKDNRHRASMKIRIKGKIFYSKIAHENMYDGLWLLRRKIDHAVSRHNDRQARNKQNRRFSAKRHTLQ